VKSVIKSEEWVWNWKWYLSRNVRSI
jgi:hypothetical protein